jgi:cytochrome c553
MTTLSNYLKLNNVFQTFCLLLVGSVAFCASASTEIIYTDQGKDWSASERLKYYSQDQGSRLMPIKWLFALKQKDGSPFMADSLARYGYLANDASNPKGLPVGFSINKEAVGLTCAACHTREITVDNTAYRIDGAPAITDFQRFAADLDQAVERVVNDPETFEEFSKAVLTNASPRDAEKIQLRQELNDWFLAYDTIMKKALPSANPWGPARLDAVGMIFNRLTGLDIGESANHIIESNIRLADAPVRYPFIWNAPHQDKTQWPGFSDNGTELLGLSRNLGEVYGVFADFHPTKAPFRILGVDYLKNNSANFEGLKTLEKLVIRLGPPKWPWQQGQWSVNGKLAEQGKLIFDSPKKTEAGGCIACHGIRNGVTRSLQKTWATPLCYVGTDERQFSLFAWTVDTGVLAGARIPFLTEPLKASGESAANVLGFAVRATILQRAQSIKNLDLELKAQTNLALAETLIGDKRLNKFHEIAGDLQNLQGKLLSPDLSDLVGAFHYKRYDKNAPMPEGYQCKDKFTDPAPQIAYESRVLQGIWATAPYLHNGSVPTLAALLEPAANRPAEFKVGPNYDVAKVGLSESQTKFDFVLKTTDCSDIKSGNSRCGHEFGSHLSPLEKAALLEYLKSL